MTGPAPAPGTIPAGPMLSMFDPIFVGIDEFGHPVLHPRHLQEPARGR